MEKIQLSTSSPTFVSTAYLRSFVTHRDLVGIPNFFIFMVLSISYYLLPLRSSLKWSPFHLLLTCALASGLVYTKEAIMLGTSNPMLM